MKYYRRNNIKDTIVTLIIIIVILLYAQGLPAKDIVNLSAALLLVAAILYAILKPLIGAFRDVRSIFRTRRQKRIARSNKPIDTMTWREFEYYAGDWLKANGYVLIEYTEYYDLGVDIIAKKDDITWGVQVKHYKNLVGIEAVRQVVVALKKYHCDRAMIITNSYFSNPAKELAKSQQCKLIDRKNLML